MLQFVTTKICAHISNNYTSTVYFVKDTTFPACSYSGAVQVSIARIRYELQVAEHLNSNLN